MIIAMLTHSQGLETQISTWAMLRAEETSTMLLVSLDLLGNVDLLTSISEDSFGERRRAVNGSNRYTASMSY